MTEPSTAQAEPLGRVQAESQPTARLNECLVVSRLFSQSHPALLHTYLGLPKEARDLPLLPSASSTRTKPEAWLLQSLVSSRSWQSQPCWKRRAA